MNQIYLDFNTTTPLAPSVGEAMKPFWTEHFLLPSQQHAACRALGEILENAREEVANLIGCEAFEIVFTSGGTEANNLAIIGQCRAWCESGNVPGDIIVSATEHESVFSAAQYLVNEGWTFRQAKVDCHGTVDPAQIESMINDQTVLVCLQAACGVTGALQPVREVADVCHSRGVMLHCDAAQVAGKHHLDTASLRADTIALSGHKMYGPKGVGALYVRRGLQLCPILYGESREMGLRPGAGNIPGEIGIGAAARLAHHGLTDAVRSMTRLRDRFEKRLLRGIDPSPVIIGRQMARLPNTTLMRFEGSRPLPFNSSTPDLVICQPRCSDPADWMTRSLLALGIRRQDIPRCMRVSIGWTTSHEKIDQAADQIIEMCASQA